MSLKKSLKNEVTGYMIESYLSRNLDVSSIFVIRSDLT